MQGADSCYGDTARLMVLRGSGVNLLVYGLRVTSNLNSKSIFGKGNVNDEQHLD